jgi:UDP-glucose 4-epimerase
MKVLVTGGAGYIGSHTLVELIESDHEVFVIDNLSNGHEEALKRVKIITKKNFEFEILDIQCSKSLHKVFKKFNPDAVIHFAGLKAVGESVNKPLIYYQNNVSGTLELLKVMDSYACKKIIFSSSATVYGNPEYLPLDEKHPVLPVNPYGNSKLIVENILEDWAQNDKIAIALRYFNPVGAHSSSIIGEDPLGTPNNLMPYISQVAVGRREMLNIFGDDYDTRDGTGERDYIHVSDLAKAHVSALNVDNNINFEVLNIGTGMGVTVKELLSLYNQVTGLDLKYKIAERRSGDVASLVACPDRAIEILNWTSKMSIKDAVISSWKWQTNNPNGYSS